MNASSKIIAKVKRENHFDRMAERRKFLHDKKRHTVAEMIEYLRIK